MTYTITGLDKLTAFAEDLERLKAALVAFTEDMPQIRSPRLARLELTSSGRLSRVISTNNPPVDRGTHVGLDDALAALTVAEDAFVDASLARDAAGAAVSEALRDLEAARIRVRRTLDL